jgi:hypothetical protein
MSQYLLLLLILACPLMMFFMMRGGHGGHAHGSNGAQEPSSLGELRRRRDELDQEIAARQGPKEVDDDRRAERV